MLQVNRGVEGRAPKGTVDGSKQHAEGIGTTGSGKHGEACRFELPAYQETWL